MSFAVRVSLPIPSPTAWLTAEKLTQQVLWLVLFSILAPILGPLPYGVFSIVMVFVGFCEFVLGEGAIEALVAADILDASRIATANLTSLMMAAMVGGMLLILAPAIAWSFHDHTLAGLIWSLLPLPMLTLLSAVPTALLRRSLQYQRLALRSIAGLAVGGLFGIGMALAGAGVWALVAQILAQRLAETVIAWLSVPHGFRLGWSARHFHETRAVAANVFAARVMIFASGQIPRLILGYTLGPAQLGLFVLGTRFLEIILNITVLPRIAVGRIELRKLVPGSVEFRRVLERIARDAAVLSFPALLGMASVMRELLTIWLDPRWRAGTIPAQLMVLSGLPLVITYCTDAAFLGAKLSGVFRKTATLQALTLVLCVLIATPFGLNAVCLSLAIRPWLVLPPLLVLLRHRCGVDIRSFLRLPLRALLGACLMAGCLHLPFLHAACGNMRLSFIALIVTGIGVYGAFLWSFSRRELAAAFGGLFVWQR